MIKFTVHKGIILPLDISNIDTDIIIPKQFLKKITRSNFSKNLFHNWRFIDEKGLKPNPSFILNNKLYKNASILVTRENFGCGSSREHAVWALQDYGFRVIISSGFADIFYNNSLNNNLLLIILKEDKINEIMNLIKNNKINYAEINLKYNYLKIINKKYSFHIDKYFKLKIIKGIDDIDITMNDFEKICAYESKIPNFLQRNFSQ
ncbi:3-isopropylmalate dehydratase small subunit (plasmid) [Buchnera aphidicola (Neophyllaphis podocarpi)]|uniref:3-isopropylmalate dehydratase small subunit n=1 Tax=Buchnera aphidicola TaxID=9 RepID=UPI003464B635